MSFARTGRAGVRFLHNLPLARVSGRNKHNGSSLILTGPTPSFTRIPPSTVLSFIRSFADKPAGRPKQHTGRAPARQTKKSATTTSKAGTKTKATKMTKKPTKKAVAKKKKVPAAKKPKTPEQLEREQARAARKVITAAKEKIKAQRVVSLLSQEPKRRGMNAWSMFVAEKLSGKSMDGQGASKRMPALAAEYKQLSPGDVEAYNHMANKRTEVVVEKHADWVRSLSGEQVIQANNARLWLKRNGGTAYKHLQKIVDPRAPKSARSALTLFTMERWASGDMRHIKVVDSSKLIAQEFRELPGSEKERFQQQYLADKERAVRELEAYRRQS